MLAVTFVSIIHYGHSLKIKGKNKKCNDISSKELFNFVVCVCLCCDLLLLYIVVTTFTIPYLEFIVASIQTLLRMSFDYIFHTCHCYICSVRMQYSKSNRCCGLPIAWLPHSHRIHWLCLIFYGMHHDLYGRSRPKCCSAYRARSANRMEIIIKNEEFNGNWTQ